MKNRKGFTLIELLAVIVILGLLMAIAIPAVSRLITQSRKNTMATTINGFIEQVITDVNDMKYGSLAHSDIIYYVPVSNDEDKSCVFLQKGGSDPFGEWFGDNLERYGAYVAVHFNPEKSDYEYYFTFKDTGGYGMPLTEADKINGGAIQNPLTGTWADKDIRTQVPPDTNLEVVVLVKSQGTGECSIPE